jgi:glutathione S-transferase
VTIVESAAIAEYLEERFPDPTLLPADPKDRALVRMFTRIADLDVLAPVMKLFGLYAGPARDDDAIEKHFARLRAGLRVVEGRMAYGPYALGAEVTFADAWLTPIRFVFNNFRRVSGRRELLDAYPRFDAYQAIATQQPVLSRVWSEMADGSKAHLSEFKTERS